MAVPKKRKSPARRDQRRAQHDRVSPPNLVPCEHCNELAVPHRICPACGYYKGRQVLAIAED